MNDRSAPEASRVSAATAILDRGWGKPVQKMEHTGGDGDPIQMEITTCADEFMRRIAGLAAPENEG